MYPSVLKTKILDRVRMIYLARRVMQPRGLTIGTFVILLGCLFWFVSLLNVARNFWYSASDISSAYGFVSSAVVNTSFVVQAVLFGALAAGVFLAIDLYKTFLYSREEGKTL